MTPEEAAKQAAADSLKAQANKVRILTKQREAHENMYTPLKDLVKAWTAGTTPIPPSLNRLEELLLDLRANKASQKSLFSELYVYSSGAEFSTNHEAKFETIFKDLDDTLEKANNLVVTHTPVVLVPTRPSASAKLESLKVPTFNGNFEEWQGFHDMFQAMIHNRAGLSGAEKLTYLQGVLKGSAANVISAFEPTDANYAEAWAHLNSRYNVKREIIFSHLKAMEDFKPQFQDPDSGLRALTDSVAKCIRSLKVQGVKVDEWDLILIYLSLKKIDPESKKQWALDQKTDLPTMKEFLEFLEKRARALTTSSSSQPNGAKNNSFSSPSSSGKAKSASHHVGSQNTTRACAKCASAHSIFQCTEFNALSVPAREEFAKTTKRCFNCLVTGHSSKDCTSKYTCKKCGGKHHTLLHKEKVSTQSVTQDAVVSSSHCVPEHARESVTLLGTLVVLVPDSAGTLQSCRVFVDSGSESHFISENCVSRLGLKREKACVSLIGIGDQPASQVKGKVTVSLISKTEQYTLPISALILPKISGLIPRAPCKADWNHLEGLIMSDVNFTRPAQVDILIGAAKSAHIMLPQRIEHSTNPEAPVAVNTRFGWMVTGSSPKLCQTGSKAKVRAHHVSCVESHGDVQSALLKFWELEEPVPSKISMSVEDVECETHFLNTHTHHVDGSYTVKLPFKSPAPVLGNSREVALNRFLKLETRLNREPNLKSEYTKYINQFSDLGYIEPVPSGDLQKPATDHYYIPHHVVVKPDSTTTKYRIVFDASAKTTTGVSLNSALRTGPKLQVDLMPLLIRFMSYNVAMSADIWKFYPQTRIHPENVDFQRFLWRETSQVPVQDWRMTRLTFGLTCAPFLAIRTLHHLADTHSAEYPWAAQVIKEEFLVDNLLSGAVDEKSAFDLQNQIRCVMERGNLKLTKWMSNCSSIVSAVPADSQASSVSLNIGETESVKTIGLLWHPTSDTFKVKIVIPESSLIITKRSVLSVIARTFDPLGWLSPVTVRPKLLLQIIWAQNLDWDQPLPLTLHQQWRKYRDELPILQDFSLLRNAFQPPTSSSQNCIFELHGFCDGSDVAYAACVYAKTMDDEGHVSVNLLAAKTKVAPIKKQSTPRSELCGAVLLTNLMTTVVDSLKTKISSVFLWSDSTVVLGRLNPEKKLPVFELNRVRTIISSFPQQHWNHVSTEDNPADCASRGIHAQDFLNHPLWLHGPAWLVHSQNHVSAFHAVSVKVKNSNILSEFITNCSSFQVMQRTIAYCLRFIGNLRLKRDHRAFGPLNPAELDSALILIIKIVQADAFKEEIAACKRNVPVQSRLISLSPFVDENGILRVGGRLAASLMPFSTKHPALLPKKHSFVNVIARHYHNKHLHAGPQLLLSLLRDQFWIIRGLDLAKRTVKNCVVCHRAHPTPASQLMGNYPRSRVMPAPVFSQVGIDYAGPFHVNLRTGRKPPVAKYYVCLYVCMVTKAIHLEPVTDLSTPAFIASLTRFISRRGKPNDIYCDGGTNFIGAKNEMAEIQNLLISSTHQQTVQVHAADFGIHFHVNPPASPHHGGLWEAGVKSMKKHLRRVIGPRHLTVDEFSTLLCQVEAVLNSRPITPLSSDPNDMSALTPGHFLIGRPLSSVPQADVTHIPEGRLSRWQDVQQRSQHFWKRFSTEYLTLLYSRPKWLQPVPDLTPGLLVLIRDNEASIGPQQWKLGRITACYPGTDGKTRVCDVRTNVSDKAPTGTVIRRPVVKLSPLPIYE